MKTSQCIDPARIRRCNDRLEAKGDYVLYWMQQSQRAEDNHALEYAVQRANALGRPVLVVFGLTAAYPDANLRHYRFMLEGIRETQNALARRGIVMVIRIDAPDRAALSLSDKAALIVCDRGYLRHQKAWRETVARQASCPVVEVESDVVVPVETASNKAEYAARTLRPKIRRHLDAFRVRLRKTPLRHRFSAPPPTGIDLADLNRVLAALPLDRSVAPSPVFQGGSARARRLFGRFLGKDLARYADLRSRPEIEAVSKMSPYLHFGQISPLYLALQVLERKDVPPTARDAYIEELVVRRELACNFVHFTPEYDTWAVLPRWARKTLEDRRGDPRPFLYDRNDLEAAETHDPYWNAAMEEMKRTGYMHGYMRMYWGKKILEWSGDARQAHETLLYLNNRYFLDGRDPNSYTGIGWIFGLHDRAWFQRPIFGKVRTMTAGGLERKSDPAAYVARVRAMPTDADERRPAHGRGENGPPGENR